MVNLQLPPGSKDGRITIIGHIWTPLACKAFLSELGIDGRAEALIAIAAPAFREGLAREWHELRKAI